MDYNLIIDNGYKVDQFKDYIYW